MPSKIFCLTLPRKFVGQAFSVSLSSGTEKNWIREGWGVSRFSAETFLSYSAENIRRGILWCFICFGYRKSLDKRGVSIKIFLSKIVCLTVRKLSVGETFSASLILGSDKIFEKEGGRGIKNCR